MSGTSVVEALYISGGCNRTPKSLDWGPRIIYALNNSVAMLSDQEPFQIKCTFNKHTDKVNCVKWITALDGSLVKATEFVSASKDKTLVVWKGSDLKYEPIQVLQGHTDNVCIVDCMYFAGNESPDSILTLIASASVDSTVRIYSRSSLSASFNCDQVIKSKMNGFALALKFYLLPISKLPLLLIGYENHKIEIHVQIHNESDNTYSFVCLHTLVGHEDWIRDIDVCQIGDEQLLLASCSQDNYVRLWKLDSKVIVDKSDLNDSLIVEEDIKTIDELKQKLSIRENDQKALRLVDAKQQINDDEDDEEDEEMVQRKADKMESELKLKSSLFTIHSKKLNKYVQYSMNLESVLYGHEDWIYTVKFHPRLGDKQPLILITASIDKTIVVWKYDPDNAIWIDSTRAGDIGGNTLGFYGATFEPTGKYIVAHGYQGALHLWRRDVDEAATTTSNSGERLTPGVINGGHFDLVEDISWEPAQSYFVSVSKDQTTRFHASWKSGDRVTWHELGRPQIHGYDLTCVSFIDRFRFVSGADEKLLRIFEAPMIFLKNFYNLCQDASLVELIQNSSNKMAQGASVPALGLSNKAVYDEEKREESGEKKPSLADDLYKEVYFNIIDLNKPPTEEHLLQNTLWPEVQKLYGHGFELFSVAVDPISKLIASACKASKPDHATIIIWQQQMVNNQMVYRQVNTLKGHELTIVQMRFSHDGKYLLSASRDRSWKLYFRRQKDLNDNLEPAQFEMIRSLATKNSYHTRIIWSCDWSHDDKYFATASRDKRLCVWPGKLDTDESSDTKLDSDPKPIESNSKSYLELNDSITACSFAPSLASNGKDYLISVGLENGSVEFYLWNPIDGFTKYTSIESRFCHHATVKRLSFRKTFDENGGKKQFYLASCSEDNSVRLFRVEA